MRPCAACSACPAYAWRRLSRHSSLGLTLTSTCTATDVVVQHSARTAAFCSISKLLSPSPTRCSQRSASDPHPFLPLPAGHLASFPSSTPSARVHRPPTDTTLKRCPLPPADHRLLLTSLPKAARFGFHPLSPRQPNCPTCPESAPVRPSRLCLGDPSQPTSALRKP